jgi:hypothetical protein
MMLREHEFNTKWWGAPVGILDDAAFFDFDSRLQDEACSVYDWVEYSAQLDNAPAPEKLGRAGFFSVDSHINFRINLSKVGSTQSADRLVAVDAREANFEISSDVIQTFSHERFRFLPGITTERLNARYALWSNQLISQHPAWCLQISNEAGIQGWFLAKMDEGNPLNLTLAMLKSGAQISGHLLFQKAMDEFARRGARIGEASFSVTNTPVMNIYASLGARFLSTRGFWHCLVSRQDGDDD